MWGESSIFSPDEKKFWEKCKIERGYYAHTPYYVHPDSGLRGAAFERLHGRQHQQRQRQHFTGTAGAAARRAVAPVAACSG
ncbi:hypothetical protein KM92DES2_11000 [uncultured Desulfovibrio sp.]|uniref:Uncharacterized protein n=1 Tax=uncultured Desulfovibrio sp. TaxID=167968 RepID=A0A212JF08_9BACT|nr:hypothetical protein KM92DES2_11000 [uncultured Desulfovibrio sp.]